jgi:DNA polymerase II large subunit
VWIKKKSEKKSSGFMDDVIAGRPIFSFPSRKGGFRLRYGRSRNTGLSAVGIHPSTMLILESFLAAGTQVRLELPGKGGVTVPVDSLEPPIVLCKDGCRLNNKKFLVVFASRFCYDNYGGRKCC